MSYIAYEGASMIDGKPIVAIVTTETRNEKTGAMHQMWILRSDISPTEAVKTGEDSSICGDCKHRHHLKGACYVVPFQAPLQVYKAYERGNYPRMSELPKYKVGIRLGAYGDPAAVPAEIIEQLVNNYRYHTGYTHQWKQPKLQSILEWCNASVDSLEEKEEVNKLHPKAKTFRVAQENEIPVKQETVCLNITVGLSCSECKGCNGKSKNIVIEVHGNKKKNFKGAK